jgi:sRNA-binding protein
MDLNQRLPVTAQASETLNPLNSGIRNVLLQGWSSTNKATQGKTQKLTTTKVSCPLTTPLYHVYACVVTWSNRVTDVNADVSGSLTNGHVPLSTSASDNEAKPVKGTQVSQPTQTSTEKHSERDKQVAARGPEKKARPTTTNKVAHETLGPLDRLKAVRKSYEVSKKVVGAARQCRSLDYHVKFLPEQKIPKLVDSSSISLELTRSRKGSLVTHAPELFVKVQTVLYLIDRPTKIRLFVSNNVCDADLPLEVLPETKESDKFITLRSIKHQENRVTFRKRSDAEDFVKNQWSVLAYIFHPRTNAKVPHHRLRDDEILPFQGQKLVGRQGSSGKVFETRIHPDHHFWNWNKEKVCVSEFSSDRIPLTFAG